MEIIISSNTSKPIYEQITSQMKAMIMSGELQTGDPILVYAGTGKVASYQRHYSAESL